MADAAPLAGRVAVVTGASRGLGRSIALALAGAGASTALVARSADALEQVAAQIAAAGGTAAAFPADVTDAAAVDAMAAGVRSGLGTPTILVNAAGVFGPIRLLRDVDPDAWVDTCWSTPWGRSSRCGPSCPACWSRAGGGSST